MLKDRQKPAESDNQTKRDRQTDRQTGRQAGRQAGMHRRIQTGREREGGGVERGGWGREGGAIEMEYLTRIHFEIGVTKTSLS